MNKRHALCVGINQYPETDSNLAGCVNDAEDWAAELRSRGFVAKTLLDAAATGSAIRGALKSLAYRAQPGDTVVVTYSGHGSFVVDDSGSDTEGMRECWCPYDVVDQGPLSGHELEALFCGGLRGVRWIVLSDACHSGSVGRFTPGLAVDDDDHGRRQRVRFLAPSAFDDRLLLVSGDLADTRFNRSPPGRSSVLMMSGCAEGEYGYDAAFRGRNRGVFTHAALLCLRQLGPAATYAQWYEQLRRCLPEGRFPQTPQLFADEASREWTVFEPEDAGDEGPTTADLVALSPNVTSIFCGEDPARRLVEDRRTSGIMRHLRNTRVPRERDE